MAYGTKVSNGDSRTILSAAATTQVKATPGTVGRLIVGNVGTTMTIDIYDHASGNNNKIVEWVTADGKVNWELNIPCTSGIRVVVGGTPGTATLVWS